MPRDFTWGIIVNRFMVAPALLSIFISFFSVVCLAEDGSLDEAIAKEIIQNEKDAKANMSNAIFPLIEASQKEMAEALGVIRSNLAEDLENKTKQFLADPEVYSALVNMAYQRKLLDKDPQDDSYYAAEALSSLHGSLSLTPGVMGNEALITRATLLAKISDFYGDSDPQMCRYIPSDFSILMSVDAKWLEAIDPALFHRAIDDEYVAMKLMLSGVLPRSVNNSDKQVSFSLFANHWLSSLDEEAKYEVALAKKNGNYCVLWSRLLADISSMGLEVPSTSKKIIAPFLVMMSRGWMDTGLWSYEEQVKEIN